jgi:sporulation protein YlmC with PRC-barrel domain
MMLILKRARFFGAVTILTSTPLVPLAAQTASPTPPSASQPSPNQPAGPTPTPVDPVRNPLIGKDVFSSDGNRVGIVDSVDGQPDGKITAINIRTGGFLGFGTRVVAIPEGKYQKVGQFVQIAMTAEEVSKLPMVKDRS